MIMHLEALKVHLLLFPVPAVWKVYSYDINRAVFLLGENSFPCLFADKQVTLDHLLNLVMSATSSYSCIHKFRKLCYVHVQKGVTILTYHIR